MSCTGGPFSTRKVRAALPVFAGYEPNAFRLRPPRSGLVAGSHGKPVLVAGTSGVICARAGET